MRLGDRDGGGDDGRETEHEGVRHARLVLLAEPLLEPPLRARGLPAGRARNPGHGRLDTRDRKPLERPEDPPDALLELAFHAPAGLAHSVPPAAGLYARRAAGFTARVPARVVRRRTAARFDPPRLLALLATLGIDARTFSHDPVLTVAERRSRRRTSRVPLQNLFLEDRSGAAWLVVLPDPRAC